MTNLKERALFIFYLLVRILQVPPIFPASGVCRFFCYSECDQDPKRQFRHNIKMKTQSY